MPEYFPRRHALRASLIDRGGDQSWHAVPYERHEDVHWINHLAWPGQNEQVFEQVVNVVPPIPYEVSRMNDLPYIEQLLEGDPREAEGVPILLNPVVLLHRLETKRTVVVAADTLHSLWVVFGDSAGLL